MSVQIALLAPATRVASRKLGPTAGSCSGESPPHEGGGLVDEEVRERVREVRHDRHQPIVARGVDRGRAGPEATQQPVQTLVEDPGGAGRRAQVPGRAVEQVLACVLHTGRLGSGQRVPAHEARVRQRVGHYALGRADVADDALLRRGRQRERGRLDDRADRRCDEHGLGDLRRGGGVGGLHVDRAQLRARAHRRADRGPRRAPRRRPCCAPRARSSRRSGRRPGRRPSTDGPLAGRSSGAAQGVGRPPIRPRLGPFPRAPPPARPTARTRRTPPLAAPAVRRRLPRRDSGAPRR